MVAELISPVLTESAPNDGSITLTDEAGGDPDVSLKLGILRKMVMQVAPYLSSFSNPKIDFRGSVVWIDAGPSASQNCRGTCAKSWTI